MSVVARALRSRRRLFRFTITLPFLAMVIGAGCWNPVPVDGAATARPHAAVRLSVPVESTSTYTVGAVAGARVDVDAHGDREAPTAATPVLAVAGSRRTTAARVPVHEVAVAADSGYRSITAERAPPRR